MADQTSFYPPGTAAELEEGLALQPKFDAAGLVTCVATDAASGDVLMVAHMNDEALRKTIASGDAWYFSRWPNALWRKGESSGQTQRVVEIRMDCDQDAVWIRVEQTGAACHTGRRSCFYRAVASGEGGHEAGTCLPPHYPPLPQGNAGPAAFWEKSALPGQAVVSRGEGGAPTD